MLHCLCVNDAGKCRRKGNRDVSGDAKMKKGGLSFAKI